MKKFIKTIILVPIIIVISFIIIFGINYIFGGYNYESDIDCINHYVGYEYQVNTVLYKYDNNNKEILLYNSNNGTFFNCILDKKNKNGKTLYKFNKSSNTPPITWNTEWNEIDKNLKFIFVDYENDIEDIDCMGYEPQGTKIYYKLANGKEESCWIYIIDKTKDKDKN